MEEKTIEPKKIVDKLFEERDNYQQATNESRQEFNDIHSAFMGAIDDPKDRSKSQEKIMKLRTEVNYVVPSIFSGSPEIEVDGVGDEDKDFAAVAEKIINYRLDTIPQAYEKIESWVKQSCVYGTSLLKVVWKMVIKENKDGTGTPEIDEPDLEVPNILDCYYNPIIADVECQDSLIFRSVVPVGEIKDNTMYDVKDELGKLNREKVESKGNSNVDQYNSSRQVQTDLIDQQKASVGTVELYDRVTDDGIQTVVDGKERLLLRDVKWNYDNKCVVKLTHEPYDIPNRFNGLGIGHNTLGLGRMIQKLSNRLQDNVNMGNNPHFLGRKGAGIDKKQLLIRAGGLTEVDGDGPLSDQIQPLDVPDIKNGALELLGRFDDEHKRASGANDLIQGAASNKTLGQDEIASTYSSNRFELINRRFKQALADVAGIILKMELENIQSMESPILRIFPIEAEVVDGKVNYSRETVYQMLISEQAKNAKFNIRVKGETNVKQNKDIAVKQLMEGFNVFGQMLPPQYQLAWAKKYLELRGISEIDKLVPDEETLNGLMQPQPMDAGMEQGMNPGAEMQQPQI